MNHPRPSVMPWYVLALAVLLSDQLTKMQVASTYPLGWSLEITSFFNLVHVLNPGAAFSFLATAGGWQRWLFLAIAVGASVWLAWLLWRRPPPREAVAYSLLLGGALGNGVDRGLRGQVIDYLDFHAAGMHWPAFNLADVAITAGALFLVLASMRPAGPAASRPPAA